VLKVDESDVPGPLRIRIRSFVETIDIKRQERKAAPLRQLRDPYPVKYRKADRKQKVILIPNTSHAFGRMMADTTNTGANNLGVFFRPAGVFLKVSTGRNVEMHPEPGDSSWISNEMWHVTDAYAGYTYKATLYSGPEFSSTDPGFDIAGWSMPVLGSTVPVVGGGSIVGTDGWCRVFIAV
jgi:hypothetical protein